MYLTCFICLLMTPPDGKQLLFFYICHGKRELLDLSCGLWHHDSSFLILVARAFVKLVKRVNESRFHRDEMDGGLFNSPDLREPLPALFFCCPSCAALSILMVGEFTTSTPTSLVVASCSPSSQRGSNPIPKSSFVCFYH